MANNRLVVIGGGLAGCEAAWQAALRGIAVDLYEMRPQVMTPAHKTGDLAELVCSNSLGSNQPDRAGGVLKAELRQMGSLLLECAEKAAVPAGGALAVDRSEFSRLITERMSSNPKIQLYREEILEIPAAPVVIASGPLTSNRLTRSIQELTGQERLFFYDAIAPIVSLESINMNIAFRASRYQVGEQAEGDYINCPMDREQYELFVKELLGAERIELHSFEQPLESGVQAGPGRFFEGCLPVEVIAGRGHDSLAFGPMRPVGLTNPHTGRRPYAVVQLRQDNLAGSLYNLVGFQTNLTYTEQQRVFRMIPGLEQVEIVRFGQMHRNTFIASPQLLDPTLQLRQTPGVFFAGQISGVEGYMGSIATGLLAGVNAARWMSGAELLELPVATMLGALISYITHASLADFQPMKANFGIMPDLDPPVRDKRIRYRAYAERAQRELENALKLAGFWSS